MWDEGDGWSGPKELVIGLEGLTVKSHYFKGYGWRILGETQNYYCLRIS